MTKIEQAIEMMEIKFKDYYRRNGDPYASHCLGVMDILKNNGFENDKVLLIAAVLHDICEDSDVSNREILKKFDERVGFIVNTLSKNKAPKISIDDGDINFRFLMYVNRFYHGVLADPYILFIKMADQIDNMQTVEVFSKAKQKRKILEIEKYFYPIYEKIYNDNILTELYRGKYKKLKKLLDNIIEEKKAL